MTEQQLTSSRRQLLAPIEPGQSGWIVSDFWIGQSRAFAHAYLPPEQAQAFDQWWDLATADVPPPKLLVALEAPAAELQRRVVERGEACDKRLDESQIQRLQRAFAEQLSQPRGPQLRLAGLSLDEAENELRAALAAIDGPCTPAGE